MKITVVGSANMDIVVRASRIPAPGETVLGADAAYLPGGKGANQAVAAARLGAETTFIGCVGADGAGEQLRSSLVAAGVDTSRLRTSSSRPTGVALIVVDDTGANAIAVSPGANHDITSADIDAAGDAIRGADALLLQLELPYEVSRRAAEVARGAGVRVLLNPAPASGPLAQEWHALVDVVTPNEHEAALLTGGDPADPGDSARKLLGLGIPAVVVTLGAAGCLCRTSSSEDRVPAPAVRALDTTAAGDCFSGALALALAEGRSLADSAKFACAAAAVSVTRAGAQPSMPSRAEAEALIASR